MAVSSRKVQNKRDSNGVLTGKAGTVYDVNIKYTGQDGKKKSYAKKGFATKKEATQHEAEMKAKLANPVYSPVVASQGKQTVKEYLEEWVENHGKANLRPSTFAGYKSHIRNHIVPYIGHVQLNQLTPAMLDNMFQQLFDKGLSNSTVRYAQRILSVSMEHARKYRYIEHNPARDIITKFGKQAKTPDPYTIEQMQTFMSNVIGTEWEMPVVLAGMYGLRMSEIIGLRTTNIDLEKMQFGVVEQMPFKVPPGTKTITEMAPTKSNDRILPITEEALPYFLRQFDLIARQKALTEAGICAAAFHSSRASAAACPRAAPWTASPHSGYRTSPSAQSRVRGKSPAPPNMLSHPLFGFYSTGFSCPTTRRAPCRF